MNVLCATNDAFEDALTRDKCYSILELRNSSVRLTDDCGRVRWFGLNRFRFVQTSHEVSHVEHTG